MAKVKVPTEYELLQQELNHAINEVKIAESNFNYADAKFFDIANEELTIARMRVRNKRFCSEIKALNFDFSSIFMYNIYRKLRNVVVVQWKYGGLRQISLKKTISFGK